MAFKIVWTPPALRGLDKVISYLEKNFTEREVTNFIKETNKFFEILAGHHDILQRSAKNKNLHRGPLNPLTIVTYRVKPLKKEIEIVNIRGARQRPLKWR
jgi:plasmid stabilization system protein ParE